DGIRDRNVTGVQTCALPICELGPEEREVDMGRPPRVVVVLPRVRARLDRGERVRAVIAGQGASDTGEVRVDRGRVLVALVDVATGGVRLPDLDELIADRPTLTVEDPPGDADALADGFAVGLDGQVRFEGADVTVPEGRGEELDGLGIGVARVLRRVPQD